MEHFDTDDLVGLVVVEDDAGRDFFGFDDGGVVEAEVEGVGCLIEVYFHSVCGVGQAAWRWRRSMSLTFGPDGRLGD